MCSAVEVNNANSKLSVTEGERAAAISHGTLALIFGKEVHAVERARIDYAFRVFAAVYGYEVRDDPEGADFCCSYGDAAPGPGRKPALRIPARYCPRPLTGEIPQLSSFRYAGEDVYLVHGIDEKSGYPDWPGEIFEWLSASLELPIKERDAVGRIPLSATVFQTQGITTLKPHAALLMAWMENALRSHDGVESLSKPRSPLPGTEHLVVCSHDVDFCYTGRLGAFQRLCKNIAISFTHYRSLPYFLENVRMLASLLRLGRPGDYLPPMMKSIDECGFRSTLFVIANGEHRRDANYRLQQLGPQLRDATKRRFPVALHASYTSLANSSLNREAERLEKTSGHKPQGNRQHWLRFPEHQKLVDEVEKAELAYDSTLGFAEACGFRNGASFAFPPYNFAGERPCSFLEIPLVIMDGSLRAMSQRLGQSPQELAEMILEESRKWSWGGISILWHNPMEPIQVPPETNRVFWECARTRRSHAEEWMSAEEFLSIVLKRYQNAGLLKGIDFHA